MSRNHPLQLVDVERGLKTLGFSPRPQKSTSHVQWVRKSDPATGKPLFHKVTVDASKSPFSNDLVKYMAAQAGISTKEFREICSKQGQKKAKNNKLKWLISLLGLSKKQEGKSLPDGD